MLVFAQDGVPTWEVRRDLRRSAHQSFELIIGGTADSFEAAEAAAAFEASALAESRNDQAASLTVAGPVCSSADGSLRTWS